MKRTQSVEDMLIAIQNTLCLVLKSDSFINNRTAQGKYQPGTFPIRANKLAE